MSNIIQILSTLPGKIPERLRQADQRWHDLRHLARTPVPQVVRESATLLGSVDWDVAICGGTLGILLGAALAQRGWRVELHERGVLQGRQQEWNISRAELKVLVELGLLSEKELEEAIATQFNPNRIQFGDGPAFWVRDVLNVGVDPVYLLATLKEKFMAAGGTLLEHRAVQGVVIHPDGVEVQATTPLKARLMLDAMGHGSPVVAQARQGQLPAGMCLVVGTCAQGIPTRDQGDLLVSLTPIQAHSQYFWEAFPARDGRTTYLFTYADLHPQRPSLEQLFEDYWEQLPDYQGVSPSQVQIQRALFGLFPSYDQSPLQLPWARTLAVGDSSGSQSPLSFGGFGAMIRHLRRLTAGIDQALACDALSASDLALLQPYQPNLSVTWLFQEAMRSPIPQPRDPDRINQLLNRVFAAMADLGDPVLKPFLQDVVQFGALAQTLGLITWRYPQRSPELVAQLGLPALGSWFIHFCQLGLYNELDRLEPLLQPWIAKLPQIQQYRWQRRLDTWHYGSGHDDHVRSLPATPDVSIPGSPKSKINVNLR